MAFVKRGNRSFFTCSKHLMQPPQKIGGQIQVLFQDVADSQILFHRKSIVSHCCSTARKHNSNVLNTLRNHRSLNPQKNVASLTWVKHESTSAPIVTDLLAEFNLKQLKEESRKEKNPTLDSNVVFMKKVKSIIAEKSKEKIESLNEEDKKKFKVIQLEHNFLYSEGFLIPSAEEMTAENWLEALSLQSKNQRLKFYSFVKKRLILKENDKLKRAAKKEAAEEHEPAEKYEHGKLFLRIYDTTIKKRQTYNLTRSMEFGIPLVIDMDYVKHMQPREIKNTAKQLMMLYSINRSDDRLPYHLHFTNCPEDNPIYRLMQLELHDVPDIMGTVTAKSYLDLFDTDQLVYLSPDGRQTMSEFDPTAVYIIGAFNDKATQQPVSYARAKQQGIKSMRFPFDHYMNWSLGSKSITLDQVMKIMTSLKNNSNWKTALKFAVPSRKTKN